MGRRDGGGRDRLRAIAVLAAAVAFSGCGSRDPSGVAGAWVTDPDATVREVLAYRSYSAKLLMQLTPSERAAQRERISVRGWFDAVPEVTLELRDGGRFHLAGAFGERTSTADGRWSEADGWIQLVPDASSRAPDPFLARLARFERRGDRMRSVSDDHIHTGLVDWSGPSLVLQRR